MTENKIIKNILVDDSGYIVVTIEDDYHEFLKNDQLRLILKNMAQDALKEDFLELGVSKKGFRIKVAEGTSQQSLIIVQNEVSKNIEMAWMFLNNFSNQS